MKKYRNYLLAAVSLSIGCATWAGKPPPCPAPSYAAISDLEMYIGNEPDSALELWVGEIERYCAGIKAMRGD